MCAISATRSAPASAALAANPGKSTVVGSAVPPQKMILGRSRSARSRTSSRSIRPVSRRTPYWTALNHLPLAAGAAPWVRWPPAARDSPMIVSPGLAKAR